MVFQRYLARCILAVALLCAASAHGQENPAQAQSLPETGHLELTFDERHPDSAIERLLARFQFRGDPNDSVDPRVHADGYDIEQQTFKAYVPDAYDGGEPYGLLVWVSATDDGVIHWPDVFDNRKLIVVSADNVGDRQNIWKRMGLQLDAVHNMTAQYNIDTDRVYISGCSKGGRIASQLGLLFADVFDGAMPMDGCDWYEQLVVPNSGGRAYRARFNRPHGRMLRIARTRNRYVLMTGELDENRDQTEFFYERGYQRAGFEFVWYLEEAGARHCQHSPEFVERGLALLDLPLEEGAIEREAEGAGDAEGDGNGRPAPTRDRAAERAEERAARDLSRARRYIDAGINSRARVILEAIIERDPETDAAAEARALLEEL